MGRNETGGRGRRRGMKRRQKFRAVIARRKRKAAQALRRAARREGFANARRNLLNRVRGISISRPRFNPRNRGRVAVRAGQLTGQANRVFIRRRG